MYKKGLNHSIQFLSLLGIYTKNYKNKELLKEVSIVINLLNYKYLYLSSYIYLFVFPFT